jgi:hypothetical protein
MDAIELMALADRDRRIGLSYGHKLITIDNKELLYSKDTQLVTDLTDDEWNPGMDPTPSGDSEEGSGFAHQIFPMLSQNCIAGQNQTTQLEVKYKNQSGRTIKMYMSKIDNAAIIIGDSCEITVIPFSKTKQPKFYKKQDIKVCYFLIVDITSVQYCDHHKIILVNNWRRVIFLDLRTRRQRDIKFAIGNREKFEILSHQGKFVLLKKSNTKDPGLSTLLLYNSRNQKVLVRPRGLNLD